MASAVSSRQDPHQDNRWPAAFTALIDRSRAAADRRKVTAVPDVMSNWRSPPPYQELIRTRCHTVLASPRRCSSEGSRTPVSGARPRRPGGLEQAGIQAQAADHGEVGAEIIEQLDNRVAAVGNGEELTLGHNEPNFWSHA
jgi:hypothetical protein